MPTVEFDMLVAGGQRVAELRITLDRVGRRRGTASEFGNTAAELLKALELWCAEVELATSRVNLDVLLPEARRELDHFLAFSRTCSQASV
jgi:hypothetical protein